MAACFDETRRRCRHVSYFSSLGLIEVSVVAKSQDLPATLPPGEVHLWCLPDDPACVGSICTDGIALLSLPEKQHFADMTHRPMAKRFLQGRLLMRRVLARYLGEEPTALAFRYNANGKPELDGLPATPLSFNLSHSASDVVLAVARTSAIGVDIESMHRADAAHRISQRFFSKSEIRDLEALGAEAPERALMLWALKESIVKANGDTVWDGLAKISLAIEGRRIDWPSSHNSDGSTWRLAGGPFRGKCFLAFAVKSSGDQTGESLVFQTYRLGKDTVEIFGFEPEFST